MVPLAAFAPLFVPPAVLLLSAAAALLVKIGKDASSAMQHFAGGVVLAAVCTELVPKLQEPDPITGDLPGILPVSAGFLLAVAILALLRKALPEEHGDGDEHERGRSHEGGHEHEHGATSYAAVGGGPASAGINWSAYSAFAADLSVDGLLVGMAYVNGESTGTIFMLSIAVEMLTLGSVAYMTLSPSGGSIVAGMAAVASLAALLLAGGVIGLVGLAALAGTVYFYFVLAFGVGACLWLVVEDLLKEAHEKTGEDEPVWITSAFFIGFLLPVVLERFS